MTRVLSEQARAAQLIRQDLKRAYPGTRFSVTSEGYSMGDNVNVRWTDGPKQSEVSALLDKYQAGNFDGMTDMYEFDNSRDDIPQTKYLFCSREHSIERKQLAINWLNEHTDMHVELDERGNVTNDLRSASWGEYPSAILYRMLSGYYERSRPDMDFSGVARAEADHA